MVLGRKQASTEAMMSCNTFHNVFTHPPGCQNVALPCIVLSFKFCTFNIPDFVLQMHLDNSDEAKKQNEKKKTARTHCVVDLYGFYKGSSRKKPSSLVWFESGEKELWRLSSRWLIRVSPTIWRMQRITCHCFKGTVHTKTWPRYLLIQILPSSLFNWYIQLTIF